MKSNGKIMLGNEAIARGAWEAGVRVATAYPGTPSTEIIENIATYDEVYCEWSPNEKVALEVAIGASVAGARSICSMKHVGLNVAADPLFTVSYTGVNAGLVIIVADDPGMHSSQNEQDSRNYAKAAKIPMLEPADSNECIEYIKRAFEISEEFDTPVLIRLTTRVSHSRGIAYIGERENIPLKDYIKDVGKYVMMPAMARKRHVVVEDRIIELNVHSEKLSFNYAINRSKEVGIITSGMCFNYAKEAFPDASLLKLGMVHPISENLIREFAGSVKNLFIIEELDPFIEDTVKSMGIKANGKEYLPVIGEFGVNMLKTILGNIFTEAGLPVADECNDAAVDIAKKEIPEKADIPRPPVMCPGCPHRGMYYVLKKLKLTVTGDIGCYTLGALPPVSSMDTCVCMGASIGMAHGMEKARGKEFRNKVVAILGDSTFIHSGITGLIDVAYNKGASTVIVLDNSITGMTGHQDNPATGKTIKGEQTVAADIVKLAQAAGIKRVRVEDPFDTAAFEKAVKEEISTDEPSVIISKRPCALLKTVRYGKPYVINQEKCKRCKRCMQLSCPAIALKDNNLVIDSSLCAGCGLCAGLCKFGAIAREEEC